MTTPPRAPQPHLGAVSHMSVEVLWKDYLERLQEVFDKADGRIRVEIQMRKPAGLWEAIYKGYDCHTNVTRVEPDTTYQFRMRFGNSHGWGDFSDAVVANTTKPPLTGEDIHKQVRRNDEYELRKVLDKAEANVEATSDKGFTPLMVAAQNGVPNICDVLLEYGADVDTCTEAGKTALMLCAYKGKTEVLELLSERGAALEHRDRNGNTAMHYAVDGEQYESVKVLAAVGADLNAEDGAGCSPLVRCTALKNNGNVLVVKQLLKAGAEVNSADNSGQTALFYAVLNSHERAAEALAGSGADPTLANHKGVTPMQITEANDRRGMRNIMNDAMERWKFISAQQTADPATTTDAAAAK